MTRHDHGPYLRQKAARVVWLGDAREAEMAFFVSKRKNRVNNRSYS